MSAPVDPCDVRRVARWLRRALPALDPCDAESLAGEAVWVHGPRALAATAAKRDAIDLLRRTHGRNLDRPAPLPVTDLPERGGLDPGYAEVESADAVDRMLAHLPTREAHVLRALHLDGQTGVQVAAELGVSPSMVTRIGRRALLRARQHAGALA